VSVRASSVLETTASYWDSMLFGCLYVERCRASRVTKMSDSNRNRIDFNYVTLSNKLHGTTLGAITPNKVIKQSPVNPVAPTS
jgi:hypothetical protein